MLKAIFNKAKGIKFNVNAKDSNGDTALILASYNGYKEIVKMLEKKTKSTKKKKGGK